MKDEFFEFFNIPKIEYKEPGRTVDDNGDICEWYVDYIYPSIEPVFMDLLHYYYGNLHGNKIFISGCIDSYSLCNTLSDAIIGNIKDAEASGLDMSDERADIKEIFEDYYGGVIIED